MGSVPSEALTSGLCGPTHAHTCTPRLCGPARVPWGVGVTVINKVEKKGPSGAGPACSWRPRCAFPGVPTPHSPTHPAPLSPSSHVAGLLAWSLHEGELGPLLAPRGPLASL